MGGILGVEKGAYFKTDQTIFPSTRWALGNGQIYGAERKQRKVVTLEDPAAHEKKVYFNMFIPFYI